VFCLGVPISQNYHFQFQLLKKSAATGVQPKKLFAPTVSVPRMSRLGFQQRGVLKKAAMKEVQYELKRKPKQ
jgi:hypothetical protein